ncbi:capsular polysaccharide biosynthesis protein [Alkalihalobacillus sp. FSL R5-0424]
MKLFRQIIKKMLRPILLIIRTIDFISINKNPVSDRTIAFTFEISKWKQEYVKEFLREYDVRFVPSSVNNLLIKKCLLKQEKKIFVFWGVNENPKITELASKYDIPVLRLEDGFVRSTGLGSMHTPPYSLCVDKTGIYFDSSKASDLEVLLNTYNFSENHDLIKRANRAMNMLKKLKISKYNHVSEKNIEDIFGIKTRRRVLVIGQVEDDASIRKGCNKPITNNDIVRLAKSENPKSEIIYKPHPDVLMGRRPMQSNPAEVEDIARVITEPLSLDNAFETIDHVYTITSLAGFEALIRGIKVTTIGAPFYSGWGVTDDRQQTSRRRRNLTVEEIFAAAYILYPKYIDPATKEEITLEETIRKLKDKKSLATNDIS